MYIPKQFEETRVEVMRDLIRAYPLATVVTNSLRGLNANHIPLQLSEAPGPFGVLRGHVARANPMVEEISNGAEALCIFHGPSAYITPSWYATKKETGKVVPTWNYSVVHAQGKLQLIDDATWLLSQLDSLTKENEAAFPRPWSISDAPADYIEQIAKGVVGVELVITQLLGKSKVSQNQPFHNQESVVAGLKSSGSPNALAMAGLVEATAKDFT